MLVNCGKNITIDVDYSKLPENVKNHAMDLGIKSMLTDAHANVTKEEAGDNWAIDSLAVVEEKLAAMYTGDIRVASGRTGDPARKLALESATDKLVAESGKKKSQIDAKLLRQRAIALITADPSYMATARETIEKTRAHESPDGLVASLIAGL